MVVVEGSVCVIHEQWGRNAREHRISSQSRAFRADMATGAGPRRALRPRRPRCCLWLLRRAASHPWTVCGHRLMDGPANRSRQGITWSPWSRGGRRVDSICILSAMLKPGGGCNLNQLMILPLPLTPRYRDWLDSTVSFEVISS